MRRRAAAITYWLAAAAVTAALLWHMDGYLRVPTGPVWDSVDRTVRSEWRAGDALFFAPDWLAGYALDRRRFQRLEGPRHRIRSLEEVPPDGRVWVIRAGRGAIKQAHARSFEMESSRRVGPLRVDVLRRVAR